METIDEEIDRRRQALHHQRRAKEGEPFFVWWNGTRMHFRTHVKEEHRGISGQDEYSDGMVEHDMQVGELLKLLDDLGIAENTVVMYSTDNGPHYNYLARCRHHAVPQREELELGRRLSRAGLRALARTFPGRQNAERHRLP